MNVSPRHSGATNWRQRLCSVLNAGTKRRLVHQSEGILLYLHLKKVSFRVYTRGTAYVRFGKKNKKKFCLFIKNVVTYEETGSRNRIIITYELKQFISIDRR